jgi:hypothetical protein
LNISISYISNFKPTRIYKHIKTTNLLTLKQKKIYCKNFFFFLFLLKYFNKNNYNNTFFLKPEKKKKYTILRAPYRHKLSRHQIEFCRFHIICNFKFILNNHLRIKNVAQIVEFLNFLKNYYIWFESNIIYQHKIRIHFNFFFRNNFLINYYK